MGTVKNIADRELGKKELFPSSQEDIPKLTSSQEDIEDNLKVELSSQEDNDPKKTKDNHISPSPQEDNIPSNTEDNITSVDTDSTILPCSNAIQESEPSTNSNTTLESEPSIVRSDNSTSLQPVQSACEPIQTPNKYKQDGGESVQGVQLGVQKCEYNRLGWCKNHKKSGTRNLEVTRKWEKLKNGLHGYRTRRRVTYTCAKSVFDGEMNLNTQARDEFEFVPENSNEGDCSLGRLVSESESLKRQAEDYGTNLEGCKRARM